MSYHEFDASYVLMRNKFGRIVALYIEHHHKRSKTCVWVPKYLVTNLKAPKKIWVLKTRLKIILWAYSSGGRSWVLDSGCTNHMIREKEMFTSFEENDCPRDIITFGDNSQGSVLGYGKITITTNHSISKVLLVESLDYNLLSVSQLYEIGYNCLFTNQGVTVFRRSDGFYVFSGILSGKLYLVDFIPEEIELDKCLIAKTNMGWLWHRRLPHVDMRNLHKLQKEGRILGLINVAFEKDRPCRACQAEKQVRAPHHSKNVMTTTRPLKMLHMNLFGPITYISIDGNKYGLVIIDDYSHFTWVLFLQDKGETQEVLKKFLKRAQHEFDTKVKKIRSDNDTKFKNAQIEDYLDEEGIKHEFSAPYTPQQNGVAERKNRALIEMSRTMLDEYKTSDRFWAEAVNTTCHATNRLYLHKLLKKTTYELFTGNKPNVSYFRVFGSKYYVLQKRSKSSKFAPRVYEGFLLGYDSSSCTYRVFNKNSSCIEITCDVVFDETNGSQVEQYDLEVVDG
jgi:transposase InsO family protein